MPRTLAEVLSLNGAAGGGGPGSGIGAEWSPAAYNYNMNGLNMNGLNMNGYGLNGPGYGLGFDFGHAANMMLNPVAQIQAIVDAAHKGGAPAVANLMLNPVAQMHAIATPPPPPAPAHPQTIVNQGLALAQTAQYNDIMERAKMEELARRSAQSQIFVQSSLPTQRRVQPLGFGQTANIAAGATQIFTIQPLVLARPKRLFVDYTKYGQYFTFTIQQVNQKSQMVNGSAVDASVYANNSTFAELDWDPCQPQGVILLGVQNIDASPHPFLGTIFCEVAV